jgi:amino-acid N-acetyltransferase
MRHEHPVTPTVTAGMPSFLDLRPATVNDVDAIHALVTDHVASDHLLPRTADEIARHHGRFVVATMRGIVVGCAELAPLSAAVAEIRSLVVTDHARGCDLGRYMVDRLIARAAADGYGRLCAFTHQPSYFVHLGFSIVPHLWLREKVFTDCVGCPLFRGCGQQAVVVTLDRQGARGGHRHAIGAVA